MYTLGMEKGTEGTITKRAGVIRDLSDRQVGNAAPSPAIDSRKMGEGVIVPAESIGSVGMLSTGALF